MRLREVQLRRSLRRIVLTALAAPVALTVACSVDDVGAGRDASLGESSDANGDDAPPIDADATAREPDASVGEDAATCAPVTIVDASFEDGPDGCASFHLLPCGLPPDAAVSGCFVDLASCVQACGTNPPFLLCTLVHCDEAGVTPDAATILDCTSCNGIAGRRPLGLHAPGIDPRVSTGDYFAAVAHLESASVRAFRDLARWLVAFDAPARLVRAANRAASDERRHARAASRIARRFGGLPPRPRIDRVATPSLPELVTDDAIAGCVGETFGALLATFQAARAADPRVRRTLGRIAVDETRHAALAWEILAWGARRLSPREKRRVKRAMEDALATLDRRAANAVDETTRRIAGLPTPREERDLVRALAKLVRTEARVAS